MPDQLLDTITRRSSDITAVIIHTEAIPDHTTDATTEALHDTFTPALITIAMTHHTRDHPHTEVFQPTPEIVAGPDHAHHITQVRTLHLNPHPVPAGQQENPRIRSKGES